MNVNASSEVLAQTGDREASFDLEAIFSAQYPRIARLLARIVRDPARAEELAVEVFLKLWKKRRAHDHNVEGWLYRTAVRTGLDELRRQARRTRYESLLRFFPGVPTPEELHAANQEQERVRLVLSAIPSRHAELLILRHQDLSYNEIAIALGRNAASIGTLLSRAQRAFRKEYVNRYGEQ